MLEGLYCGKAGYIMDLDERQWLEYRSPLFWKESQTVYDGSGQGVNGP